MAARARSFIGQAPTPHVEHAREARESRIEPIVFDLEMVARFLGISIRAAHGLRRRPEFIARVPAIALLSPSRPRWRRSDLEAFVASLPTIDEPAMEPASLRKGRAARKAKADQATVANEPAPMRKGREERTTRDKATDRGTVA